MGHSGYESREKSRKKNYLKRKELGLCQECNRKRKGNYVRCGYHLKKDRGRYYKNKLK